MQVGTITVDGRQFGVVSFGEADDAPSFLPDGDGSHESAGAKQLPGRPHAAHRGGVAPSHGRPRREGKAEDHFTSGRLDLPAGTPESGDRVHGRFAEARDRAREELKAKPWLNEKATHIIAGENPHPEAATALWEETINRMAVRGTTFEKEMRRTNERGYYEGYSASVDPQTRRVIEAGRDRALNYSNVSNYATDNASNQPGNQLADNENRRGTFIDTRPPIHGEHFKGPDTRIPSHQKAWRSLVYESEALKAAQKAEDDKVAARTGNNFDPETMAP
jgi:hypothetical protein